MLCFHGGSKGRNDYDIFRMNFIPWDELCAVCIHDEPDAALLKILIDFLVVDHLAQEEDPFIRIFFQCPITYFYRVFHAIAKTEMAGEVKFHRAEVQFGGSKVLFARIF